MTDQTSLIARKQPQADYRITLNGRDISRMFAPQLNSLTLREARAEEPDTLDIVLDDSKGTFDIPNRGAEIKLSIGWRGDPLTDKGVFTVDEVEHSGSPDILTIRAKSASERVRRSTL